MIVERWRDVVGYEDYYSISDRGNVRSLERVVPPEGWRHAPGQHPTPQALGWRRPAEQRRRHPAPRRPPARGQRGEVGARGFCWPVLGEDAASTEPRRHLTMLISTRCGF